MKTKKFSNYEIETMTEEELKFANQIQNYNRSELDRYIGDIKNEIIRD